MTPEAALLTAVIETALNDLSDPNPVIRGEANSFFFAGGAWAEMRAFYCAAVGVDPAHLQAMVRKSGKANPPLEPGVKRKVHHFSVEDLRKVIPTDSAFQLADLPITADVTHQVKLARLQVLVRLGVVEKVGPTQWALTVLQHPHFLTNKQRVLSVLEHRPMTTKEIAACLWPRLPVSTVWAELDRLMTEGHADKVAPGVYRLRAAEQIAA